MFSIRNCSPSRCPTGASRKARRMASRFVPAFSSAPATASDHHRSAAAAPAAAAALERAAGAARRSVSSNAPKTRTLGTRRSARWQEGKNMIQIGRLQTPLQPKRRAGIRTCFGRDGFHTVPATCRSGSFAVKEADLQLLGTTTRAAAGSSLRLRSDIVAAATHLRLSASICGKKAFVR